MDLPGPDIINSMDPIRLKELIIGSQEIAKMRGGEKGALAEEQPTIDFAFATVVTIQDIKAGDTFSKNNIWVKRPGTGPILADSFDNILGKQAVKNIDADQHLQPEDIEGFGK